MGANSSSSSSVVGIDKIFLPLSFIKIKNPDIANYEVQLDES
jgi:hypothetical protein